MLITAIRLGELNEIEEKFGTYNIGDNKIKAFTDKEGNNYLIIGNNTITIKDLGKQENGNYAYDVEVKGFSKEESDYFADLFFKML